MKCVSCGCEYVGHHRSKWCPDCRDRTVDLPYSVLGGQLCGRRSVSFAGDRFVSRPEPFCETDVPDDDSRCRYQGRFRYWISPDGVQVPK